MRAFITVLLPLLLALACDKTSEKRHVAANDAHPGQAATTTPTTVVTSDASVPAPKREAGEINCERQPFATKIDIAEASGATWMADGTLLVVGDSGTNGAFLRLDARTGTVLKSGKLPLDDRASDDLEGLSRIGDTLYGITSSGYMREWEAKGQGFSLTRESYSLATNGGRNEVCKSARDSNCGPNYEGLCLIASPEADDPCVGYAAAKAQGTLKCLVQRADGRLALNAEHRIKVAAPKTLSGCHFDKNGRLWFGNNVFAANAVGFVVQHEAPKSAVITRLGPLGLGFPEAIATGPGGQVFRFSDTAGSPSLLDKYICR